MRSDRERLQDIKNAIAALENYADRGRDSFDRNSEIQSAVLYQIAIVGEAVRSLSSELKQQYPNVPWLAIVGMRNIVIHQYFEIDFDIVWSVLENDLPQLKEQIHQISIERA